MDVFRGATMAAMVIVNTPGDWDHVYWPLLHSEWDGWTPTDLIFPFFLFIVGVSITLSRRTATWGSMLRRSALIVAIGLVVGGYPRFDLSTWRIPGVLQRIGVCYFAAVAAYRSASGDLRRRGAILVSLAALLLISYWLVMLHVAAPGGYAGDLSPEGNLGAYIDRALMQGHLWRPLWDPEGLLSTIPAIATTLLGVAAGLCLASDQDGAMKAAKLAASGAGAIVLGEMWSAAFPINKSLWSSSYAVFAAGIAMLLLALCHWTIDVKGWRAWTKPFAVLGSNALTLYVLSGLMAATLAAITVAGPDGTGTGLDRYVHTHYFAPLASPKAASLLYAIANLAVLFCLLAWMYRRRILLRV